MKRGLKKGDILYLGLIELELLELDIIQKDFNGVDSCPTETGYGFAYTVNKDLVWIPKSAEQLLSYTPYTITKSTGFSYKRPWQPKAKEVVWVRDYDHDNWKLGVFEKMTEDGYEVALRLSNGKLWRQGSYSQCKPFDSDDIEFNEEKVKEPAQPIKPLQLQKGDLVVVWDDDLGRYLRPFHSLNDDGLVRVYSSENTNNVFQKTQVWKNYTPYVPLKGVTPVTVTYETKGRNGDEQFIRLLVKNESDIEKYSNQQGLVKSSYIYDKGDYYSYSPYNKENFKFD